MTASGNLHRRPVHAAIGEEMIHTLVHAFYARIREDVVLGTIFARAIGADSAPHIWRRCVISGRP